MTARMDLNSLLLFHDVVNAGSINRAAAHLNIAKSTISRRLHQLEQQLGVILIKRGARGLSLTEVGQSMFVHCERVVAELDEAALHATDLQREMSGPLRISMPAAFSAWVSDTVVRFVRDNPLVRLEIEVHNRWVDVSEEPFDVSIHLGTPVNLDLPTRRLGELSRAFYASPAYLSERGTPRQMADLVRHDFVQHQYQQRDSVWPKSVLVAGERVPLLGRVVVNHAAFSRDLVCSGLGVGILADVMCAQDVEEGRLIRLDLGYQCPALTVSAILLGHRPAPSKTRAFLDVIADYLKK